MAEQKLVSGFWASLHKPIMALAPMANVTDAAFRRVIAKYGKPDVMWTEFVSADGLCSAGQEKLLPDFWFTDAERPIVAQIFGANPSTMATATELIVKLGFDGVDINMGCPDRAVERQGAGAALIKNPELAKKIILAVKKAAGKLPVSVKTRIGYGRNTLAEWLPHLLETELAAVTIHARTRKEMSDVPAHWDAVVAAASIRDKLKSKTLILGNGDVANLDEAKKRVAETGCDGVMIGRGIFGNPWLFGRKSPLPNLPHQGEGIDEKFRVMIEHTELFQKLFAGVKNFEVIKKHFKAYVTGFDGAKELRAKLMDAGTVAEIEAICHKFRVLVK